MSLGTFDSIEHLWKVFPNGGKEGDTAIIAGKSATWNKYKRRWVYDGSTPPQSGRNHETFTGNVTVNGVLTVAGSLRVHDLQNSSCGLFDNQEDLTNKIPRPRVGYWAYVGSGESITIYRCDIEGEWINTQQQAHIDAPQVELTTIRNDIADNSSNIQGINDRLGHIDLVNFGTVSKQLHDHRAFIESVDRKVTSETTARTNAISDVERKAQEYADKAGKIKKVKKNGADLPIDAEGAVNIIIEAPTSDANPTQGSTNFVQSGGVYEALQHLKNAGSSLRLNPIDGGRAYTISLLDEDGEEISTTEEFSGGGGSASTDSTFVILKRITPPQTIKAGTDVKLQFSYDQQDVKGNSTGNGAKAFVSVVQGATTNEWNFNISAESINEIDVTKYLVAGANKVSVKVIVDDEKQSTSSIAWTITTVDLNLSSSFDIATATYRGTEVKIPFALKGIGTKTLSLYVDGKLKETKDIISSNGSGAFSVDTSSLPHGTHTVQMVAELEVTAGKIKSNSIYFGIIVIEQGYTAPVFATRFDYSDGTILSQSAIPYLETKQYDRYKLAYAVWGAQGADTILRIDNEVVSTKQLTLSTTYYEQVANHVGDTYCSISAGSTSYNYILRVNDGDLSLQEPTDGLVLHLSASGRTNTDTNKSEWVYKGVSTTLSNVTFGGDGWHNGALRLMGAARATINYKPLSMGEMAFSIRLKVSNAVNEEAEVVRCMDDSGKGFVITAHSVKIVGSNGSSVETKLAPDNTYCIGFVAHRTADVSDINYDSVHDRMLYLYIDGHIVGGVQLAQSETIRQSSPSFITLGSDDCVLDVYDIRAYNRQLTEEEMLNISLLDKHNAEELSVRYQANDIMDGAGRVSIDKIGEKMPYMIITGQQENGVATLLQAAVVNNKKAKFPIDSILFVDKANPHKNFLSRNGYISLQGTSSLAYPIKNYRIYTKTLSGYPNVELRVGVNAQGQGGTLIENGLYSFRDKNSEQEASAPVNCWCLKADYAESSSSHNTGMAKLVERVMRKCGVLTPPQQTAKDKKYPYDVRTTVDGFPIALFYRKNEAETPVFLGKYNMNNDKSTEAVFGFLNIPGYHIPDETGQQVIPREKNNPTQCWEFLNNDYPMGQFLDVDFDAVDSSGVPNWKKVFEARFPEDNEDITLLKTLCQWVNATRSDTTKFRNELHKYFNVENLLSYEVFTQVVGAVDQKVKNAMLAFFYDPNADASSPLGKMRGYYIFYDNDTILGLRNDGRMKYHWAIDHNTIDPELSTTYRTVYAYAGHDSVLWNNLRKEFSTELGETYTKLRAVMTNDLVYNIFDTEQSDKFCERLYSLDAINKYVIPKTQGVNKLEGGVMTNVKYSYLESMQGNRKSHRHWWFGNRIQLFDAKYNAGSYKATDLAFKGNSAVGATINATATRDFYFAFQREGAQLVHQKVSEGQTFSYTYQQEANIGTIFHFYGGAFAKKIDLSSWGGFTDLTLPNMPRLEELILGGDASRSYPLTEIAIGNKLPMLRKLDMRGFTSLRTLNLSDCTLLQELDITGSGITSVVFAKGCLIETFKASNVLTTLTLRDLPNLTINGIILSDWSKITHINFSNCPNMDWRTLIVKCPNLTNVRIEGVSINGIGDDLDTYKHLNGISIDGSMFSGCGLVGTYQLTKYREDIDELRLRFPELNIEQAPYTGIEWDDSTNNEDNITNLDNGTGFRGTDGYVVSGHIKELLHRRDRVLTKYDADTQTLLFTRLLKDNANYYADGQPAKLDGTQGDIMVYEPERWTKGVNDHYGLKKYGYWSLDTPAPPNSRKVLPIEMTTLNNIKLLYGETLSEASSTNTYYTTYIAPIDGAVGVRWPSAFGIEVFAYFLDAQGTIVARHASIGQINGMEHGLYLFKARPEGAVKIAFCVPSSITPEYVLLTESLDPFEFEPDWVYEPAYMLGATLCIEGLNGLRCVAHDTGRFANYNMDQAMSMARGLGAGYGLMDYDRWRSVVLLWMATVGSRISTGGNLKSSSLSASFAHPLDRIFFSKADNTNQTYYSEGGVEAVVNAYHLLGYDCWIGVNPVWLDGVIQRYGYNLNGNRSSYNLSGRETIQVSTTPHHIAGSQSATKYTLHGRYMDVLSLMTGSPSKSNYWAWRGQDANNVNFKYFFVNKWWNINNITGMEVGSNKSLMAIRLQYTGKMRELSNQEYRALWT